MKVVIFGLTITSAWGNGHATTYRSLIKALARRKHEVVFIEKDVTWYRENRDLPHPEFCNLMLYNEWQGSHRLLVDVCRDADAILIGSYFADATVATHALLNADYGPVMFYDIDTPITLAALRSTGRIDYLESAMIGSYDAYLSFTGGPALDELRERFGARKTFPFYCSVDPDIYKPVLDREEYRCDLGYLGTYAPDRQYNLKRLLNEPARLLPERRFIVAGAQYPHESTWELNVKRFTHIAPADHAAFYSSAQFSLNLTRKDMVDSGYSPSVRLFEASACGAAILSDDWPGLDEFFTPGEQILLPRDEYDVVDIVTNLSQAERLRIGRSARERILAHHTSAQRATEFESIVSQIGSVAMPSEAIPRRTSDTDQAHVRVVPPASTLQ